MTPLRVEVQPGYRGAPLRFRLGDLQVEVAEVIDRWMGQDHRYFKVRAQDENFYILKNDYETAGWELHFFARKDYWVPAEV